MLHLGHLRTKPALTRPNLVEIDFRNIFGGLEDERTQDFEQIAESLIDGQLQYARDLARRRSAVAICD